MFTCRNDSSDLFELKENEEIFKDICDKLKKHPFDSPWRMCFEVPVDRKEDNSYEVQEISLPENANQPVSSAQNPEQNQNQSMSPLSALEAPCKENLLEIDEVKLSELKESLMTVQENSTAENVRGIEILHSISLMQVPKLCDMLSSVFSNDTAVTWFLKAILTFAMPLSLSITSALVKCMVYPQVFEEKLKNNTSRILLVAVLNFTEVYPKPMVDEVIVPCMKRPTLEPLQLETLVKMTKTNLPSECVSYCLKKILEQVIPNDNVFTLLQNLIERKVNLECQLQENVAWKVAGWKTTCSKNMKFTKLLISILTVYGNELTVQQITIYQETIRSNETIMKKAAENVLKKLCKNI